MISLSRALERARRQGRAQPDPAKAQRLPVIVVAGGAMLIAAIAFSEVFNADHPVVATGIALQTLAGLFAAIQLWANSASDALVAWAARQIAVNRWYVAGLFDGRLRSLALASAWFVLGLAALRAPALAPNAAAAWLIAIPAVLFAVAVAAVYFVAMFMMVGSLFASTNPPPEGEAVTALHDRLTANDWIWPLVGAAFLLGGMLQVAVA